MAKKVQKVSNSIFDINSDDIIEEGSDDSVSQDDEENKSSESVSDDIWSSISDRSDTYIIQENPNKTRKIPKIQLK